MPNKLQIEQPIETQMEREEREEHAAFIRKQVIDALGRPTNLRSVHVFKLWSGHYRVNVIVGENAVSVSFAHSYFLVVDGEGGVITATPRITKQY